MKKLIIAGFLLAMVAGLAGCVDLKAATPYGKIAADTDSQIFVYSDADVRIKDGGVVRSDDTTLIIIGVKEGADVVAVFKQAMTEISKIFKERSGVYKKWLK